MSYKSHLKLLDQLLVETQPLWQPHPFKELRPGWCSDHPELTRALLNLDEATLSHYTSDNEALITLISAYIPQLSVIPSLVLLPATTQNQQSEIEPRLYSGIPGRKWQQITSLYESIENPHRAITEWCGGKGYLGRLLSREWQQPVTTLEQNPQLVEAGTKLAGKHHVNQQFRKVDVLHDRVDPYLSDHHAIALHACGDLHRELVRRIIETGVPSFSIVPCCYHLGRDKNYTPFISGLKLKLSREALRLAVNETVTAHNNEIEQRNRDMAWKLGFQQLWQELSGSAAYHSFTPVPKAWLKEGFKVYCQKLAEREGLTLPADLDWSEWEARAYKRQHEVMRLQLLRQCFKRVLELWLIMDMTVYLEENGYSVSVHVFCERVVTPRNIIIEGKH
ncbi:Methyltransferase domain-containing protein [Mariprofundus aestuarium]|uniref:Methyltransferase domain-containing protein n=1 Tax=Mariprofundus aestuarium TaxID=1921086 RepID=A0A2K8KWQ7_MARES|nr:methyltransferase [Mariprofundus aestuarium]ATX79308.1 Methyltransferase domain-containing protein [Mariprofundus aestuarium]